MIASFSLQLQITKDVISSFTIKLRCKNQMSSKRALYMIVPWLCNPLLIVYTIESRTLQEVEYLPCNLGVTCNNGTFSGELWSIWTRVFYLRWSLPLRKWNSAIQWLGLCGVYPKSSSVDEGALNFIYIYTLGIDSFQLNPLCRTICSLWHHSHIQIDRMWSMKQFHAFSTS